MAKANTQKPVANVRIGLLQGTMWANQRGPSFSFSKSFKKDNKWESQKITIFAYELPMLKQIVNELENKTVQPALPIK